MKHEKYIILLIVVIISFLSFHCKNSDFIPPEKGHLTNLDGEYLGKIPPGTAPELFASSTISDPEHFVHSAAVFSPDKKEVSWSVRRSVQQKFQLYFMKMTNGQWTTSELLTRLFRLDAIDDS